ncbi:MAG TPA: WecB/TagA/CpsF family glycosyltransferase [Silvibacterium sp.]|jgi:N-acetylglucosaminyldiphosphoundecaprenol N-acetyl-beta-D-mannosaminyltransferase|nr:WecB/TagA/CpsF family glycosyltransferase [Silvibacterium sp.]
MNPPELTPIPQHFDSEPGPYPPYPLKSALLPKPPRFIMDRVPVDRVSMDYAAAWIVHALKHRGSFSPLLIMGPNAQLVTLAARDARFAEALNAAHLAVPDGVSVVLASRLLGQPVPQRVTGGDLMERLCAEAARHGFSVFFLGGLPGAATAAAVNLERRYPALRIAGTYCPPRGFENDSMESAHIRQLIADSAPDLLCVAFGAPKQEIWMHENCPSLPVGAAIAVGAAFDTQAGLRRRAPRWTHKAGMEWLYRFLLEPRRLWRRYLIGNPRFLLLVLRQRLVGSRRPVSKAATCSPPLTESPDSLGA